MNNCGPYCFYVRHRREEAEGRKKMGEGKREGPHTYPRRPVLLLSRISNHIRTSGCAARSASTAPGPLNTATPKPGLPQGHTKPLALALTFRSPSCILGGRCK